MRDRSGGCPGLESGGGCPGLPSLIIRTVSVDVKQHRTREQYGDQEVCESGGGRPGLPVPNNPCGLCGLKATPN